LSVLTGERDLTSFSWDLSGDWVPWWIIL